MNKGEVLQTLLFENCHGGVVSTGRHLKICVFDSRAESVNAGRVEGFASYAMERDVVSLLEANDGHLGVAITLHHQSLIGVQRKNRKGAAPVNIKSAA